MRWVLSRLSRPPVASARRLVPLAILKLEGDTTMRFMMLVKATKGFEAGFWPDEKQLSEMAKWTEELIKAGARPECGRLQPSSQGVRVHHANGKFVVTDGPFAESKEL